MREKILEQLKTTEQHVSGEALSAELGVSRAAIHKHIKKLKELGYAIESVPNRGYRLLRHEAFNIYELKELVEVLSLELTPYFFETIDSTNTFAKTLERPSIVVALEQTAGRGRRGRTWISEKGQGIYFSLLLMPQIALDRLSAITQLCGLAVARSIGDKAQIKWPNDIYIHGRKVCGILTELQSEELSSPRLILGIGINLFSSAAEGATDLKEQGLDLSARQFLHRFLESFFPLYEQFLKLGDLSFVRQEINDRSYLRGKRVTVSDSEELYTFEGIDAEGLAILNGTTPRRLSYGEVSVRRHED